MAFWPPLWGQKFQEATNKLTEMWTNGQAIALAVESLLAVLFDVLQNIPHPQGGIGQWPQNDWHSPDLRSGQQEQDVKKIYDKLATKLENIICFHCELKKKIFAF